MVIGGLQKISLIDYPGKICAILFLQGCNFRCPYCHNPELVNPELYGRPLPEEEVWAFLEKRVGKLDGVVITAAAMVANELAPGAMREMFRSGPPEVLSE
jgi:pyruvate formate lyase activating enzyme